MRGAAASAVLRGGAKDLLLMAVEIAQRALPGRGEEGAEVAKAARRVKSYEQEFMPRCPFLSGESAASMSPSKVSQGDTARSSGSSKSK